MFPIGSRTIAVSASVRVALCPRYTVWRRPCLPFFHLRCMRIGAANMIARPSSSDKQHHSGSGTDDGEVRDTIIIGSGPAGYTSALYAARAQMHPLMIAGVQHGGQLQLTSEVENFPGYSQAVAGPDLMEDLRKQAERFGTEMLNRDVTSVDVSSRPFRVSVRKREFFARSLIIATGAEAVWLGAEGEDAVRGKGVVVIGGGDSAMEEALFLTKFASKVTIVHRRDGFRASKIMIERARAHPKIEMKTFRTVRRWVSNNGILSGALLVDPRDGQGVEKELLPCGGAFLAIGHKPMTAFMRGARREEEGEGAQVELDDSGYIVQKQHTMTSVEGVFACGDVVDKRYRQAITAAGMGCQAAIDCERWLAENP